MNIYENLQIVWSQFCTDFLLFIYIRSTSNIYLFIGIQIRCQQIQTNSYSVTFGYSQYLVQHSKVGRKTTIRCYLLSTIFIQVWYFKVKLGATFHAGKHGARLEMIAEETDASLRRSDRLLKLVTTKKKFYSVGSSSGQTALKRCTQSWFLYLKGRLFSVQFIFI
jgi:hypothetical protein